jgi:hypothetical protein
MMCEARIPGVCAGAATNRHHRQLRSRGGLDTPENLMDVCGTGTTGCHGWIHANVTESTRLGWIVPSWENPELVLVERWPTATNHLERLVQELAARRR